MFIQMFIQLYYLVLGRLMCFDIERNSQLICYLREIYQTIARPIPSN